MSEHVPRTCLTLRDAISSMPDAKRQQVAISITRAAREGISVFDIVQLYSGASEVLFERGNAAELLLQDIESRGSQPSLEPGEISELRYYLQHKRQVDRGQRNRAEAALILAQVGVSLVQHPDVIEMLRRADQDLA